MQSLRWSLIARMLYWLALALFGWVAARFTVAALLPDRVLPEVQVARQAPAAPSLDVVQQITQRGLFGDMPRRTAQPVVRAKPSATIAGLLLHGVLAAGDDTSVAMVASDESGGVAKVYALNAELPGGGVLYDVLPDHIVIDVGATRLKLYLRKLDTGESQPAPAAAPAVVQRSGPPASSVSLAALQNDLKNDPGSLARRFVARPYRRGGIQIGYSVRGVGQSALMQKLGLRNGDIVTQVNGIELNSQTQAFAVYQELLQAKSVVAKVKRGNRTFEIRKTIE